VDGIVVAFVVRKKNKKGNLGLEARPTRLEPVVVAAMIAGGGC
jgi:hypothetical protein